MTRCMQGPRSLSTLVKVNSTTQNETRGLTYRVTCILSNTLKCKVSLSIEERKALSPENIFTMHTCTVGAALVLRGNHPTVPFSLSCHSLRLAEYPFRAILYEESRIPSSLRYLIQSSGDDTHPPHPPRHPLQTHKKSHQNLGSLSRSHAQCSIALIVQPTSFRELLMRRASCSCSVRGARIGENGGLRLYHWVLNADGQTLDSRSFRMVQGRNRRREASDCRRLDESKRREGQARQVGRGRRSGIRRGMRLTLFCLSECNRVRFFYCFMKLSL